MIARSIHLCAILWNPNFCRKWLTLISIHYNWCRILEYLVKGIFDHVKGSTYLPSPIRSLLLHPVLVIKELLRWTMDHSTLLCSVYTTAEEWDNWLQFPTADWPWSWLTNVSSPMPSQRPWVGYDGICHSPLRSLIFCIRVSQSSRNSIPQFSAPTI